METMTAARKSGEKKNLYVKYIVMLFCDKIV